MWGALLVGVAAVHGGRMNGVLLAGIALIPLVAFELVTDLPGATQTLARVRRSAARVLEVLDTPPPVAEPAHPQTLPLAPYAIRTRGLRARYPDAADAERGAGPSHWALDGVDLDLSPGRRVAVVGPSGAGKTTLAGVLLRFLEYERPPGAVTLGAPSPATLDAPPPAATPPGGTPLAELDGDGCRRVVGLVAQDAHIFDSTLEENLRLARRDASDAELLVALEQVRLLDWVAGLPLGLQTEVGERGARMSGGQRQRLAIARALLADFPILVLDEPGEHLDTPTADAILADILTLARARERATLLITHRLQGLQEMDEILVLDRGRVAERGTHAQLITRFGGRYAALWRLQGDTFPRE